MSESIRRRILLAVLLPLPLTVLLCLLFLLQVRGLNDRTSWVEHTQTVLSQARLAQGLLIDQETGLRGLLLTADPVFLEPLHLGRDQFTGVLDRIAGLTIDNVAQQHNVSELRESYNTWWSRVEADLASHVELLPQRSPQEIADMLARRHDMDVMRGIFSRMMSEEQRLLQDRRRNADAANRRTIWIGVLGLIALGLFLVWHIRRLITAVDRAYEKVLAERNTSLASEKRARAAAEALAAEISERSVEMEHSYRSVRDERDEMLRRLSQFEKNRG